MKNIFNVNQTEGNRMKKYVKSYKNTSKIRLATNGLKVKAKRLNFKLSRIFDHTI